MDKLRAFVKAQLDGVWDDAAKLFDMAVKRGGVILFALALAYWFGGGLVDVGTFGLAALAFSSALFFDRLVASKAYLVKLVLGFWPTDECSWWRRLADVGGLVIFAMTVAWQFGALDLGTVTLAAFAWALSLMAAAFTDSLTA